MKYKLLLILLFYLSPVFSAESLKRNEHEDFEQKLAEIETVYHQKLEYALGEWNKLYDTQFEQLELAEKAELLILGCDIYTSHGNLEKSEALYKELESILEIIPDFSLSVRANISAAIIESEKGNKEKALQLLYRSHDELHNITDPVIAFHLLSSIALIHYKTGEFEHALEHYLKASEYIPSMLKEKKSYSVMNLYSLLGLLNLDLGKNEEGLQFLEKAFVLAHEYGSKEILSHLYINRGIYHRNVGNLDAWYKDIMSSYNLSKEIGYPRVELTALTNLTDYLLAVNRPKEAQEKALLAIAKAQEINDKREEAMSLGNLGVALFVQGFKEKGIQELEKAILIVKKVEFRQMESMMLNGLVNMYADTGNFEKAYYLLREQSGLENELFNKAREKALANLQNKLDLHEKDRANEELKQDLLLKSERLNSQELEKSLMYSIIIISILVLLFIILLALRIREKNLILEVKNSQLTLASQKDPLTGLSNRRGFEKFITHYWEAVDCELKPEHSDIIFIMDIDHFKSVNDTYGHAGGDYILKQVASIISKNIRDNEIVVRWGGEEFLMYLKNVNIHHINKVAKRLLRHVSSYDFKFDEHNINVTMSLGFILNPFSDSQGERIDWSSAIKLADEALYLSKENGRNRATGVIRSIDINIHKLTQLSLNELIETDKVKVVYLE